MSLTSPSRRLSVPPLAILEGRGCRALGGGVEDGISHPLLITASSLSGSHPQAQPFPFLHQGDDLQLSLLCNLSSKGGKQSTSAASYSSQRRCGSLAGRFSSCSHPF